MRVLIFPTDAVYSARYRNSNDVSVLSHISLVNLIINVDFSMFLPTEQMVYHAVG